MNKTYLMVPVKPVKHDLVSEIDKFIHVPLATYDTYGSVKIGSGLLINNGVLSFNEELIPTELSELNQDTEHRLVTDSQIEYWDEKVNVSDLNKYYTKSESDSLLNEKTDKTTTNDLTKRVDENENNIDVLTQNKADKSDIIDNLTTNNSNQMLSARQGYRLNNMINDINSLLKSDNVNLDTIQEIVNYIENNKDLIDSIMLTKVNISDVIDNLTTTDSTKPLSANQGVILKEFIDSLPEWAKQPTKPTYYYSEILERPTQVRVSVTKVEIPTRVSQLENDSNFLTDLELTSKDYATSEDVRNAISDKATTSYVDKKVADLVNSAPDTLDTLGELATAIKENEDVVDALNNAITNKANKSELLYNIVDAENNSLIGNDISSNEIHTTGYIYDNNYIFPDALPVVVASLSDTITNGYYAIPSEYLEIGGEGYKLYEFSNLTESTTLEEIIDQLDSYGTLISEQYKVSSSNMVVLGSKNESLGENSIVTGKDNLSSGNNSVVCGKENILIATDSVVSGQNNISDGGCNAVFGARNEVNENQASAFGYRNKVLKGAYFSNAMGVGNINQGTATSTNGGYNLAGSEYSSAEGIDNIAGGNVTYDGVELADINRYSATKTYNKGDLTKRNGYVFKAKEDGLLNVIPNPITNLDKWEIIEPVVTEQYARASKASGEKCIAKNTGAFVHGYRLKSARDYQTVLGKYNAEKTNAMFVVGTGTSTSSPRNTLEVLDSNSVNINGETNVTGNVNIKGGSTTATLRETTSGEFVISGQGGIRFRPNDTASTSGGIAIKTNYIAPESKTTDLGSSTANFRNAYISNYIYVNGTPFGATNFVLTSDRTNWNNKADKTYVDNYLTTLAGYDAAKTQVLKNINGTFTWVDEI